MDQPFNYERSRNTATRLLTRFSQAEYLLSRAGATIPGANEWDLPTQLPPQKWTLQGISKAVEAKYADGVNIKITDRQLMFAAFPDEPKQGDVLTINGKVATVLDIKKVTELGIAWIVVIKG